MSTLLYCIHAVSVFILFKWIYKVQKLPRSSSLLNYCPSTQEQYSIIFVKYKINLDSKPTYFISILPKYDFNGELFISFEWEVVFFSNFAPPGTRAADVQYNSTGVRAPVYDRIKEQAYVYLVGVGQLYRKPVT